MQIYKNRPLCTALMPFGFALVLNAVCAVPLRAQSSSAGFTQNIPPVTAPQAPVPPSVTPPSISPPVLNMSVPQKPKQSVPAANQKPHKIGAGGKISPSLPTASDISALSSLLGNQNPFSIQGLAASGVLPEMELGSASTRNAAGFYGQNDTAVLLQAIIEKLDTLQKTVELQNAPHAGTDRSAANRGNAGAALPKNGNTHTKGTVQNGRILRFIAGNYNILPSCTAIFISQPETDGSFLLTGDRTYRASDTIYGETFYMLFKAAGAGNFNVAFSLSQHTENPQSLLYALTRAPFLQAVRTGNLVTMRTLTENTRIDLLLDIDFDAREKNR
ncbi:hypothetical protein H0R92_12775 [Treponema sp. OMZ 840]|uniref:hypothetical protein n=1 Tax=Treponema sp. OMZ 840 TaxID=244313 RepID=UPI003D8D4B9F